MSGDVGEADPRLGAALNAFANGTAGETRAELLAAFVSARVFAAISATSTAEATAPATGLRAESKADMAVLLIEAADGSRALPVFSDLAALGRWRPDARPVLLSGAQACGAAVDERASALVINPAAEAVIVTDREVITMAQGWVPVGGTALAVRRGFTELSEPAAPTPANLTAALRAALSGEGLRAARLLDSPDGRVLGVATRRPLDPVAMAALAARVARRMGSALPAEGLDLLQVPVTGPGRDVLKKRWFTAFR